MEDKSTLDLFIAFMGRHPYVFIESFCVFIPFYIGFYRRSKLTTEFRWLLFYVASLFIMDIPLWLTAIKSQNNRQWSNIQEFVISALLFFVLYKMIKQFSKIGLWLVLIGLAIIATLNFDFLDFSSLMYSYVRIVNIVLCFVFFYDLLEQMEVENLLTDSRFYFFSGLLLSSLGTILLYYFINYTSYFKDIELYRLSNNLTENFKYLFIGLMSLAFLFDTKPSS